MLLTITPIGQIWRSPPLKYQRLDWRAARETKKERTQPDPALGAKAVSRGTHASKPQYQMADPFFAPTMDLQLAHVSAHV